MDCPNCGSPLVHYPGAWDETAIWRCENEDCAWAVLDGDDANEKMLRALRSHTEGSGDYDKTCPGCGGQGCVECDHKGHIPAGSGDGLSEGATRTGEDAARSQRKGASGGSLAESGHPVHTEGEETGCTCEATGDPWPNDLDEDENCPVHGNPTREC